MDFGLIEDVDRQKLYYRVRFERGVTAYDHGPYVNYVFRKDFPHGDPHRLEAAGWFAEETGGDLRRYADGRVVVHVLKQPAQPTDA